MENQMRRKQKRFISIVLALLFSLAAIITFGILPRTGYVVQRDISDTEEGFFSQMRDFFGQEDVSRTLTTQPEPVPSSDTPGPGITEVPLIIDDALVYNNNGIVRNGEPVSFGFPFPETNGVTNPANIAVFKDMGGNIVEVPSQVSVADVLSRWGGDATNQNLPIKWALLRTFLDTPSTGSNGLYRVRFGPGVVRSAQPQNSLTVTQNAGSLFINTGSAIFEISQNNFNFFTNVWIDRDRNGRVEQVASDLVAQADPDNGLVISYISDPASYNPNNPTGLVTYRSQTRNAQVDRVFVEPGSGTLYAMVTAEGRAYDSSGNPLPLLKWRLRFHFFSGKSSVTTDVLLVNEGNYGTEGAGPEQHLYFRSVEVNQKLAIQPTRIYFEPNIGLSDLPLNPGEIIQLEQKFQCYNGGNNFNRAGCGPRADDKFFLEITRDGTSLPLHTFGPQPNFVGASKGFLTVTDGVATVVTLGMENFWQNFPTALALGDRISLRMFPKGAVGPATPSNYYMPVPKYGDRAVLFEGGRAVKQTYLLDFNLGLTPGQGEFPKILALTNPLFLRPSPQYLFNVFQRSGIFGRLFVPIENWGQGPTQVDPTAVQAMRRAERILCNAVDHRASYFGQRCGESAPVVDFVDVEEYRNRGGRAANHELMYGWWNFGDLAWASGYAGNHYDLPETLLWHALRGGGAKAMQLGREHARHMIFYDHVWTDLAAAPPISSLLSHTQRYEKGDYHGNNLRSRNSHQWFGGSTLYALLTGDKDARLALEGSATTMIRNPVRVRTNGPQQGAPYAREAGWRVTGLIALYDFFGRQDLYNQIVTTVDLLVQAEELSRRGWFMEEPTTDGGMQFWIEGIGMQAIARYYLLGGRVDPTNPLLPRAKATVLRAADLYTQQTTDPFPLGECMNVQSIGQQLNTPVILDHEYPSGSGSYYPLSVDNFWIPPGFPYPANPSRKCDNDRSQVPFYFNLLSYAAMMTDSANPQELAQRQRYTAFARKLFSARVRYFNMGSYTSVRRDNPLDFSKINFYTAGFSDSIPKEFGWTTINMPSYLYLEWWLASQQTPQIPTPQITSIMPSVIPQDRQGQLIISGSGFSTANPTTETLIDGLRAPQNIVITVTPSTITLDVPASTFFLGRHTLQLNNPGAQPPASNTVEFVAAPSFLIPSLGPAAPPVIANTQNNRVVITGGNLIDLRTGTPAALLANGQLYQGTYTVFPDRIELDFNVGDQPSAYSFVAEHTDPFYGRIPSDSVYLNIIGQPSITLLSPQSIFNTVENTVIIRGIDFAPPDRWQPTLVPSLLLVNLNNNWIQYPAGIVTVASTHELRFEVPIGITPAVYEFAVQNTLDPQQFPLNLRSPTTVQLTVRGPTVVQPTITSIMPSTIQRIAASTVVIQGTGIINSPPDVTRVLIDGNFIDPRIIVLIDVVQQRITLQIPPNVLDFGQHTVQLENAGQPPSTQPFFLTVASTFCGNTIVEPGEECDPPLSGSCPQLGQQCNSICRCSPAVPMGQPHIDLITPEIIANTQSSMVTLRGLYFLDPNVPPAPTELLLNSVPYPNPYTVVHAMEIQVPITVPPGTPRQQRPFPGFYTAQVRVGTRTSAGKFFTIIGEPVLTSVTPQIILNNQQQTIMLTGEDFVPAHPDPNHPVVLSVPFIGACPMPTGRFSNVGQVRVLTTQAIALDVPANTVPGCYSLAVQNAVTSTAFPPELRSNILDVFVVPPGCGNGVLEPGEQCELGIPCSLGSCTTACQCQLQVPGPGPSGGGGGGGGGGGSGGGSVGFALLLNFDTNDTYVVELVRGSVIFATYNDREYSLRVDAISPTTGLTLRILPRYAVHNVRLGGSAELFFDHDALADVKVTMLDVTRSLRSTVRFKRLTPFSSRYLGPRPDVRRARVTPVAPVERLPLLPLGEQPAPTVEEDFTTAERDTFGLLVRVLAGAIIVLIVVIIVYVVLRRPPSATTTF